MEGYRHFFNIEIATIFHDANIATLFENLCYWIAYHKANNTNSYEVDIDGQMVMRTFTYNSLTAFCRLFPYWSKRQIENYLTKLRDANLIIKGNFNKTEWDRTSWYCLVDESWLQGHIFDTKKEQQNPSPEPEGTDNQSNEESDTLKQGNAYHQTEKCILPNREMHTTKQRNAYYQTGKCILPNREMHTTKQGNAYHQTEKCISPNREMHTTKQGNAFPQTVKCIPPNREIDTTKQGNGFPQTVTTIPDINSDINTTAATARLKIIFNEIDSTLVFDNTFYPAAVLFMHNYSVRDFSEYCKWLYGQVQIKSPKNFRNYYYKVFFLDDNILAYLASVKQKIEQQVEEAKKQLKCPVCDTCISFMEFECPKCGLDTREFENEKEIMKTKKYLALPAEIKTEYEVIKNKIIKNGGFKDYKLMESKLEELDIKYGLIPPPAEVMN